MASPTVDLHLHTTASDGGTDPRELIREAAAAGLTVVSYCDHESIEGYLQAREVAQQLGVEVIPGVELVTYFGGREVHLLGYFVEPESPVLRSWLRELREDRNAVAEQIVHRLNEQGFAISFDRVQAIATEGVAIGKNHFLWALREAGYISTREEMIFMLRTYLSHRGLAYVDYTGNPFAEAVEIIRECGGLPVLAHPGLLRDDALVLELLKHPGVGLEVYYCYLGDGRDGYIEHYARMAQERGLFVTGGSDYHGRFSPDVKLGRILVPDWVVPRLKAQRALLEEGVVQSG
ncbi:MAG: PHP domain-containing protein [Syntrophomonadaceae bacterium]|nr:PHP domain-containing protein [Syntrophomonadaceae bacterium]